MRISAKPAAIIAAVALMVPVGIAQATHDSGKLGAPGQVCKPQKDSWKTQLKTFRSQTPKPSNAEIKAMRQTLHAGYKGCIKGAAEERSDH